MISSFLFVAAVVKWPARPLAMVTTGLYMRSLRHRLADISLVIAAHTLGMLALSFLPGRLTDRWRRGPVILSGAALLVLACTLAPLSPEVLPLSAALFRLGLGWNFCYVGGSTLLSEQLSHAERAKTQGTNEWLLGLATAAASLGSGLVFALTSFAAPSKKKATAASVQKCCRNCAGTFAKT